MVPLIYNPNENVALVVNTPSLINKFVRMSSKILEIQLMGFSSIRIHFGLIWVRTRVWAKSLLGEENLSESLSASGSGNFLIR